MLGPITNRPARLGLALLALLAAAPAAAQAPAARQAVPIPSDDARILPALASRGMVASQEARATRVGIEVLKRGGNAVDAAVAVGFALAVTLPQAGNLGGGGFMLVHLAERDETVAIDYRETAPKAASADMFLKPDGEPDREASTRGGKAVGVPGTVRGLAEAHRRYGSGKLTLAELIAPAERLAREGIGVEGGLADSLPRGGGGRGGGPSPPGGVVGRPPGGGGGGGPGAGAPPGGGAPAASAVRATGVGGRSLAGSPCGAGTGVAWAGGTGSTIAGGATEAGIGERAGAVGSTSWPGSHRGAGGGTGTGLGVSASSVGGKGAGAFCAAEAACCALSCCWSACNWAARASSRASASRSFFVSDVMRVLAPFWRSRLMSGSKA